jgi:hypothetical protein
MKNFECDDCILRPSLICAGLHLNQVNRLLLLPTRLGFLSGLQTGYEAQRHQ